MTYVNRVAEITHSMVDRYGGAANKNIGEAFLLVWKFHDPKQLELMDEIN
jgi:class 3 adenylate cyclase